MRMLFLGAGATGGYFGGRLAEAGREVCFLLRPRRAELVESQGLVIHSPFGDATLHPSVVTETKATLKPDFIFLTCKAYDLEAAIDAIAPAMNADTTIVPLLNGMAQLDALDARFGARRVMGGFCAIEANLDPDGVIRHWSNFHRIRFGERDGSKSARVEVLTEAFSGVTVDAEASDNIIGAMWEKWLMLASLAGTLCLMRADLATVVAAPGGRAIYDAAVTECQAIATAAGYAPGAAVFEWIHSMRSSTRPNMTASMLRDLQQGHRVEADHVIGDLIARAAALGVDTPILRAAYCHLKCYEALSAVGSALSSGNSTSR